MWVWQRNNPAALNRVPYQCESWRCATCARHEAAVTFARIKQAVARPELDPSGWVFAVLTLDRNAYYGGRRWSNVSEAYRALSAMSNKLLKRLRREYGEPASNWVAVVEAHRSGWPHINILMHAPALARDLETERMLRLADPELADAVAEAQAAWREKKKPSNEVRERARKVCLIGGRLLEHASAVGWGRQSTAEAARDTDALAGYVVKLAGQHEASMGELAKVTQAPTMAPARFRRLRSGKGFLPPRYYNPDVTGVLVRRRRAPEGDWETLAVNAAKDPAQQALRTRALELELELIREEEELLSRGRMPALPPVRQARQRAGSIELESLREASERRWAESVRALTLEYDSELPDDWKGYGPPVSA